MQIGVGFFKMIIRLRNANRVGNANRIPEMQFGLRYVNRITKSTLDYEMQAVLGNANWISD